MIIKEDLLYYIWQSKTINLNELKTTDGQSIEIINFGHRNHSSGPDFSNARIKIQDIIWAGNVEMHVYTSDWQKHKHDEDPAYKNVILHVVFENDLPLEINGVPILELKKYIDKNIIHKYHHLMKSSTWIACENQLHEAKLTIDGFSIWSHSLVVERLERKISTLNLSSNIDWEDMMYKQIAKYFGATQNKEVFHNLACNLPLFTLIKNNHQPLIIEALIFGVAGFLYEENTDEYHKKLKKEFDFQKSKYKLKPINKVAWKNFGMYAPGLPTFRLAQFSGLMLNVSKLFSLAFQASDLKTLRSALTSEISEYWQKHYIFGKAVNKKINGELTVEFKDRIIINAIIPVLFSYARYLKNDEKISEIIEMLSDLKPEKNSIVTKWKTIGLPNENATQSQALIELKTEYCDKKRCLNCKIGVELMKIN